MNITRIVYAYGAMGMDWIVAGGDPAIRVPIDFCFFLLDDGNQKVLVDAGCDGMEGFCLRDRISPVEALRRHGVEPEEIGHIIITHGHHDHIEGIRYFPNAHIYIQKDELARSGQYILPTHTVTSFDETLEPFPGVRVIMIGGHSIGSCILEVGDTVLCGDECYGHYNIENRVPTPKCRCPERSLYFIQTYAHRKCILFHQP